MGGTTYTNTVAGSSNRLTQMRDVGTTANLSYDAAGHMTGDGVSTFTYNDRGRMSSATTAGGVVSYLYNGLNQRVFKTSALGASYYVYDEAGQLLGEYDQNGTPLYETIYLNTTPVGAIKQGAVYNVDSDQIDTPRMITRQDNQIVWRWDTAEAFGASAPDQNPSGLGAFVFNQRFPGQVFDAETGLTQNWNREYNARQGRYIQSDPIGLRGGVNTYAYVGGNPTSNVDPTGLAYFGVRPLQGLPWLGPLSNNPLDNWSNTAIAHEQLFFEDGKLPGNVGFFGNSKLQTEPSPSGCRRLPGQYNDCVMRMAAQAASTGKYNLATNNCQSWADRAREQYEKLMKSGIGPAACGL